MDDTGIGDDTPTDGTPLRTRAGRIWAFGLLGLLASGPVLVESGGLAPAANAATLRVPTELYPHIQAAVDSAAVNDTVLVEPGTYRGLGNRNIVVMKNIVIRSEAGLEATTIDVEGRRDDPARGFLLTDALSSAMVLEGFTIRNGFMSSQPSRQPGGRGSRHDLSAGGVKVNALSSPIVRNLLIEDCESEFTGGGMSIEIESHPLLQNIRVTGCVAGIQGGGISIETGSNPIVENCSFTGNRADLGGGISVSNAPIIRECTVAGNNARLGGGLYVVSFAEPMFERTLLWSNCSRESGETLFIDFASGAFFDCCGVDTVGATIFGVVDFDGTTQFVDPLFCDPADCGFATNDGDYRLAINSPYTGANSPCAGPVGYFPAGCDAVDPVLPTTWGHLKSRFHPVTRDRIGR